MSDNLRPRIAAVIVDNLRRQRYGQQMTDDLRTRIIDSIYGCDVELWDWLDENYCGTTTPQHLADTLIRELGNLRQEPHQCGSDDCSRSRIISDWTAND